MSTSNTTHTRVGSCGCARIENGASWSVATRTAPEERSRPDFSPSRHAPSSLAVKSRVSRNMLVMRVASDSIMACARWWLLTHPVGSIGWTPDRSLYSPSISPEEPQPSPGSPSLTSPESPSLGSPSPESPSPGSPSPGSPPVPLWVGPSPVSVLSSVSTSMLPLPGPSTSLVAVMVMSRDMSAAVSRFTSSVSPRVSAAAMS